jgi:uncharacterized protein YlaI
MQIECEICGLITNSDNADLIEGDGYVSPSEYWVCARCSSDVEPERTDD